MSVIQPPVKLATLGGKQRTLIIANRTTELSSQVGNGATYQKEDGRILVRIGPSAVSDVRLVFGNYYVTTGEQANLATFTFQAAYERSTTLGDTLSRTVPITFNGQRSVSIAPGDTVISDPIPGIMAANTDQYFRTSLQTTTLGDLWPVAYSSQRTGETFTQGVASAQVYNTGALTTVSQASPGWGPLAVIGTPLSTGAKAVIMHGDSIMRGNSDTMDSLGNQAYGKGLIDLSGNVIPHIRLARDSDEALYNVDSSTYAAFRRTLLYSYATHYVCDLGTNDLVGSRTVAQLQGDLTTLWTRAKSYGLKTAQILINPRMTSPAGTPISGFESGGALRDPINAWIRTQAGNGVLDAVIDHLSTIEGTPGYYKSSSITSDGIHMNASGYALCAPVVKAWINSN